MLIGPAIICYVFYLNLKKLINHTELKRIIDYDWLISYGLKLITSIIELNCIFNFNFNIIVRQI